MAAGENARRVAVHSGAGINVGFTLEWPLRTENWGLTLKPRPVALQCGWTEGALGLHWAIGAGGTLRISFRTLCFEVSSRISHSAHAGVSSDRASPAPDSLLRASSITAA